MNTWQTVASLLTASGVGAFAVELLRSVPALRKARAEREGVQAGTDKTRTELELQMIAASKEHVAFMRAELDALRTEFVGYRQETLRQMTALRMENEDLTTNLAETRAEVLKLRGVVAALGEDLGTHWGPQ